MLILCFVLPLVVGWTRRARRLRKAALEQLSGEVNPLSLWRISDSLKIVALISLIFALAQPAWLPHPISVKGPQRDVVLALDISRSMLATDVFPSRLDAARIAVLENINQFKGQRIGLITFAGAASVRVPLTLDHNFVRYILTRVAPTDADVGSTSLQAAIEKSLDVVLDADSGNPQDLILFTDGEDHISDIEATAIQLQESQAQVWIIGLGDPLVGARIPSSKESEEWMQFEGGDVMSRLDETKLRQLAGVSPRITYIPVGTQPFDLRTIYQPKKLPSPEGTTKSLEKESSLTVYREGYAIFIGLALILWILSIRKQLFPAVAALALLSACSPTVDLEGATYSRYLAEGHEYWQAAQAFCEEDPKAAWPLLKQAQEAFLLAALLIPEEEVARQIVGVSTQLASVEKAIDLLKQEEADLQVQLEELIALLQGLHEREKGWVATGQKLLRKRPPATAQEKAAVAVDALEAQNGILTGSQEAHKQLTGMQGQIRDIMKGLPTEGATAPPPSTEYDEALNELSEALLAEERVQGYLQPDGLNWARAHSEMRSSERRLNTTITLLSQSNQSNAGEEGDAGDESDEWEFDEQDMEWSESDANSQQSMNMNSSAFRSSLENNSLPAPDYSPQEILEEEAVNLEQRAKQKSRQSGANVEKNW